MRIDNFGTESNDRGWTFVEAIVVIAIILLLSGTVAFSAVRYVEQARVAASRTEMQALALALQSYYLDTGTLPTTAQGLDALWQEPSLHPVPRGWAGPYVTASGSTDPWGNAYVYAVDPRHAGRYQISTYGADGFPGGEGSSADHTISG